MDEAIWAAVGIISAVLALGIVASLLVRNNQEMNIAEADNAIRILAAQCNQVCSLPENTAASVNVKMPSGVVVSTELDRLCITSAYDESQIVCQRCNCRHSYAGIILNLSDASGFFQSHTFRCRYQKLDTIDAAQQVQLNCSG